MSLTIVLFLSWPTLAEQDYELSFLLIRSCDQRVLAAREEGKLRTPASTLKVLTAVAALEGLGPKHRYRTVLQASGSVHKGRLDGDLYLRGEADPELVQADLESLAQQIWLRGIRRVDGDLVVDGGPYSQPPYGHGWAWDDAGETYSPEISGLVVDGGVISLDPDFEAPWLARQAGSDAAVWLVPGQQGVTVVGPLPTKLAAPQSTLRSGAFLREHLENFGIKVYGEVRLGKAQGEVLAYHDSRPLEEILKRALRVSDNLAMELIARSNSFALPKVLSDQRLRVVDGSGLSRYNLISTAHLTKSLLAHPELKQILPKSGEGTLNQRFVDGAAQGQVIAKTGTLSSVSGLAGYLFPDTEKECVFAILINGHLDSTAERKALENELVQDWARSFGFVGPLGHSPASRHYDHTTGWSAGSRESTMRLSP